MNYWQYVSLGILGIGLLMLFIVDRILGTIWKYVASRNVPRMVDGITR